MFIPSLLVLDVDGTVLDEGYLPPQRHEAINAVAQEIPILLSSGRAPESMVNISKKLELYGPHGVTNGGALVTDITNVEILHALTEKQTRAILDELAERGEVAAIYKPGIGIFTTGDSPRFDIFRKIGESDPIHVLPDDLSNVVKVLTIVNEESEGNLREVLADETTIQRTHEWFLEWNAKEASKGSALLVQAERMGVDPANVIAVGDSENDISMFKTPAYGVAVQNAHPLVKEAAQQVLETDLTEFLFSLIGR